MGHTVFANASTGGLFAFPYFASQNTRPGRASIEAYIKNLIFKKYGTEEI